MLAFNNLTSRGFAIKSFTPVLILENNPTGLPTISNDPKVFNNEVVILNQ